MKVKTLLIAWHNREPVYSVDFHPSGRLATGGADKCVNIWKVREVNGEPHVDFLASLTRHQQSVNAVRFSPNGEHLATASDDGTILIWQYAGAPAAPIAVDVEPEILNKENWSVVRLLRGVSDIYGLCWSPCSLFIATGSTDNTSMVWEVSTGRLMQKMMDHAHYIQGVAWDPRGRYLATQSSDRSVRIYKSARSNQKKESEESDAAETPNKVAYSKLVTAHVVSSVESSKPSPGSASTIRQKLFLDETTPSFFRRLAWSLDGSLLVTPMGQYYPPDSNSSTKSSEEKENASPQHLQMPFNCLYLFTRGSLNKPALCLPCGSKPALAVRFSPQIYTLRPTEVKHAIKLSYRMVFAVATFDGVSVYDTQHAYPLCRISGIHYASHCDLAWSADGHVLVVASLDGYCTFITFAAGELGQPISAEERERFLCPTTVVKTTNRAEGRDCVPPQQLSSQ